MTAKHVNSSSDFGSNSATYFIKNSTTSWLVLIILLVGVALVLFFARERRSVWLFVFLVQLSFDFFELYYCLPAISKVHRPSRTNDQLANYAIMLTPLRGRPPEKNGMPLSVFGKSGHAIACGHDLRVR